MWFIDNEIQSEFALEGNLIRFVFLGDSPE